MEDLDSLLADLNDNTTNTKQNNNSQSSRIDLDELDDLMNDLNENDNNVQNNQPQDDFDVNDLGIQEEPTVQQQSGGATDELDDLLEGLSSVQSNNPPPQQTKPPVQQNRPSMQQNRPSMQQTKTPTQTRPSMQQKPAQQPQIDTTLDDLDALVDDLGSNTRASAQPTTPTNKPKNTSISSDDTLDELDMLMNDLDAPPKTTPVKATPPPQQNRPSQAPQQNRPSQVAPQQNRPSQVAPQQNRPSQVSPQVQSRGSSGAFPTNPRNTQSQQVQPRNTVATFGNNQSPQAKPMNNNMQDRSTVGAFNNNQQNRPSQTFNNPQQNRPSQTFNNPQQNRPSQQFGGGGGDDLDDLLAGMDDMNVGGGNQPRASNVGNNQNFGNNTRTSNNFANNTRTSNNFGGNNQGMGGMGGMNRPQPQPINFTPVPVQSGPSRGICGGCNQPIYGQILQALGKMWHPEHFVCGNCRGELGTANFYEQEGKPHCENCYQQLFCPRCASCDQPIMSRVITALGKKWHPEHFVCTTCQKPFPGGTFYEREGYPYCQEHYYNSSFAVKCASCGEGIVGDCINALGQQWHTNCFVCQYCHKAFTSGQFYEMNGMPYCEMHYYSASGAMCAACNKSITGKSVSALGKNWHPEHFVCGFCYNPIPGGNYTERDGKAYCNECHGRLYS